MKKAYLDSSAFFKIFFGEMGGEQMEVVVTLAKHNKLILVMSNWVENECMWAAMKKYLDEKATKQEAFMIINLMADTIDKGLEEGYIESYAVNEKIVVTSRVLIEEAHMHPSDALHVLFANASGCDYFLTADKELVKISYSGLALKPIYLHDPNEVAQFFADVGRSK